PPSGMCTKTRLGLEAPARICLAPCPNKTAVPTLDRLCRCLYSFEEKGDKKAVSSIEEHEPTTFGTKDELGCRMTFESSEKKINKGLMDRKGMNFTNPLSLGQTKKQRGIET
ncbi:hypothetical protein ATANTOWER_010084, partial [Ataeniobius toweri]|nr:hypothetical protein [Ataeniobius toweri]